MTAQCKRAVPLLSRIEKAAPYWGGFFVAMQYERNFELAKVDEAQNLVFGWASVARDKDGNDIVDKQGDIIPPAELERAAYDFVLSARAADVNHSGQRVGDLVEAVVFTAEKRAAMGIPDGVLPDALWVGFRVSPDVTKRVKAGELREFSIGGRGKRVAV